MIRVLLLLLLTNTAYADTYDVALDRAREAVLIQIGVQDFINKFQSYTEDQAKRLIRKVKLEKEVAIALGAYKIYKDKSITIPLPNNKSLQIATDHVTITIGI